MSIVIDMIHELIVQNLSVRLITFPHHEWSSILDRLASGKTIFTTRISNELGKYTIGDIVRAPWGQHFIVVNVKRYNNVMTHPFKNDLTPMQLTLLSNQVQDVIELDELW
jgi:hypothetical protein